MVRKIIWNKTAAEQFGSIQEYLQNKWGDKSVEKFTTRVFQFLDLLEKYPFIGTVEHPQKDIRGFIITHQTQILYKVTDNAIHLLSFFDVRQNPDKKSDG